MDHIPSSYSRPLPLPDVRLYADEYDQGPFLGYLKRIGWVVERDITNLGLSSKSRNEVHRVLQSWLYFGILHEATGKNVSVKQFGKTMDGIVFLSSCRLTSLLEDWIHEPRLDPPALIDRVNNLSECVEIGQHICDMIHFQDQSYLDEAFHLSIQLMYEYLARAVTLVGEKAIFQGLNIPPLRSVKLIGSDRLVANYMKHDGWCESNVHMLQELFSTTELVFASSLNPPGRNKQHSKDCNRHKCHAYRIKNGTYTTKHVSPDCTCEFVYACQDILRTSLCGEPPSIPIIAPSDPVRKPDGRLYANILSSGTRSNAKEYIAISHVWSDGLGNNDHNAIPLCQFNRIVSATSRLNGNTSISFWLDTLCFPLAPKDAYDQALICMRQSYEDAVKVLVFDAYLLEHDASRMSEEEMAMRIACAPWNRRLWTLQEGVLAKFLAFQFRDSWVDLTEWTNRRGYSTSLRALMFSPTWLGYASLRALETETSQKMNIVQAKRALTWRSTSEEDDEPLCLGNLVGTDPESVVRTFFQNDPVRTRIERMKLIWRSLPQQYSSTVFWNSPKLHDDGFRWAPASLIGGEGCGRIRTCDESATWRSESGFLVTLPGFSSLKSGD
ncbi:hypothetical protein PG999_014082 [Apiospora kogelbergensis]|uniref:Heterokaryon incompatibility domain-containing protein n=1 Tax=Apiospora kogelbergensis TaxID=1337665 RepID=A0AAW0Q917_9PEZI